MNGPDGQPSVEPQYAPPVDPWAAAAAEHPAAQHPTVPTQPVPDQTMLDSTPPDRDLTAPIHPVSEPAAEPAAAGGERGVFAYRRVIFWGAAAVTVAVAASAAVLVWWWPREAAALDFRALADVRTLAAPASSTFLATQVAGDRTYLAGAPNDGPLVVLAVQTSTGDQIWRSDAAGPGGQWERIVGLPGENAVAAFGRPDPSDPALRLVVLGGDKGALQWERPLGAEDKVLFVGGTVIVAEKDTAQVVGLDLHDHGKVRWTKINPKDTSGGTATAVVGATTVDDLAGPADVAGTALAPDLGDDTRFVQIGADRSAQVFDADSGKAVTQRANVAEPDDIVLAHDGELFVAAQQNGYQVLRYDLAKLGQPAIVYTAPDSTRQLTRLSPCDTGRLCLVDMAGYDAQTTDVVAVDAAGKGQLWRRSAPEAESLVPVGKSVLVGRNTSPASVRLIDGDGATDWDRDGSAVRLDRGNVLLFAKPLPDNAADVSVAGQHLGGETVQLGPMTGAVTSSCTWNAAIIACAAGDGFVLRRFAD